MGYLAFERQLKHAAPVERTVLLICVNITLDTIANDTAIEGTGEKQEDMLKFLRMEFNEVCDTHWRVNSPMFHTKIQPTLLVLAFVLLP